MVTTETLPLFAFIDFLLIAVAVAMLTAEDDSRPLRCICAIALMFVALSFGSKLTAFIPGTDATRYDVHEMIEECEVDLPRNQKCVIDINVRPEATE